MLLTVISGSDDSAVKSRATALMTEWLGADFDRSNDLEIVRGDDETVNPEDSLNEFLASAMTPPFLTASLSMARAAVVPAPPHCSIPMDSRIWATNSMPPNSHHLPRQQPIRVRLSGKP